MGLTKTWTPRTEPSPTNGSLLYVAEGKIKKEEILKIIESGDRKNAGITAIPDGLYLNKVFYGSENYED